MIKFKPNLSKKGNHKYTAIIQDTNMKKQTVKFGDKRYQHYHDKIGFFSHLDHNNKKRRTLYRKRHSKILDNKGQPFYKKKYTPSWFSWNYLW